MNPFQYDTEHRKRRKETKKGQENKNIKETDGEDADIRTRQGLKLSTKRKTKRTKFFSVPRGRMNEFPVSKVYFL